MEDRGTLLTTLNRDEGADSTEVVIGHGKEGEEGKEELSEVNDVKLLTSPPSLAGFANWAAVGSGLPDPET